MEKEIMTLVYRKKKEKEFNRWYHVTRDGKISPPFNSNDVLDPEQELDLSKFKPIDFEKLDSETRKTIRSFVHN